MEKKYDLIVVGAGSGGLATAFQASKLGAKCLLVEKHYVGGTCINSGCIPKRILNYSSLVGETLSLASQLGFEMDSVEFNWSTLQKIRATYIKRLHNIYDHWLQKAQIEFVSGKVECVKNNTIKVDNDLYSANHIVIATGCRPKILDIPGTEHFHTSTDVLSLDTLPKNLTIVGNGYIACEFAGIFNVFGSNVTVVMQNELPLVRFDPLISETWLKKAKEKNITFLTNHKTSAIEKHNSSYTVKFSDHDDLKNSDAVLCAIGRTPNTDSLCLDKINIGLDERDYIVVDEYQNTNIEGVYALGDVAGKYQLTPVAIATGRKLAKRLFGNDKFSKIDFEFIPSVVFTHPPIGTVGYTEKEALEKYGKQNINVYEKEFTPMQKSILGIDDKFIIKIITLNPDEKIIGLHIIGDSADEIIQGFAVAIKMGATKKDFLNSTPIHPIIAEELILALNEEKVR